ncbi:MAG: hypothetical protein ACRET7_13160 [Burkholderiales bacterium]
MDFDLRLKALIGLADSQTSAALEALKDALEKAQASLNEHTQYDLLEQSLSILEAIAHRFKNEVTSAIISFIPALKTRRITYSAEMSMFAKDIASYQNASSLAVCAIDVLMRLRYVSTEPITRTLLKLSVDENKDIRSKAIDSLKTIAAYDLDVFYGPDRKTGIGGEPQRQVLRLVSDLEDKELIEYHAAVLGIAESLLSPTLEGTRWSSTAVTISHLAVPADGGVVDIRGDTIRLLRRLYELLPETSQKMWVIGVMNDATRPHRAPSGDEDVVGMITRNSQDVLEFYRGLVGTADFAIVQKIESLSYWVFYHAPNEQVKRYALAVETAIAENAEYQTYKILIGFEGIFESWEKLRKDDKYWEETDKYRKDKATEFANSITAANFDEWRARIIAYAKTQSQDLATFPNFYYFLQTFAKAQPKLALKLISEEPDAIAGFIIPILRGLWDGPEQPALRKILDEWIEEGRYLYASTKQFLDCPTLDRALVKRLLERAKELNELDTVSLVMTVAASNYNDDESIVKELFIPALEILTEHGNPQWIFELWFRREARAVIASLDEYGTDLILKNLMALEKIDYHAEEILYLIAQKMPQKVLTFLCQRLSATQEGEKKHKTYDAIPFTLHKLNKPLATIPNDAVRIVRTEYDGNFGMFIFRGAHLLKTIFPQFSSEFEAELLRLVEEGGDDDLEFVVAVLRNYEGQTFIHNVCKAMVNKVPTDSQFRTEVTIALQNTGVVSGAYGFAEAYDRKKAEIQGWLSDPSEKIREFAARYVEGLDHMIIADRRRADEDIALRKQRFDE